MLEKWFQSEKSCFVCGQRTSGFLCIRCSRQLSFYQKTRGMSSFMDHRLFFVSPYFSRYKELIAGLKYRKDTSLARGMAYLMCEAYLGFHPELPELLLPIPAGPLKEKQRGFNQSRLLAEELSKLLGIPVGGMLSRRDTRPLSRLSGRDREPLLKQSMKFEGSPIDRDRRLLVIDDIYTTGATMREAARVLKEEGCRKVDFLFFSRQEMFDNLKKWFPEKNM